jgi:hypothetical protein
MTKPTEPGNGGTPWFVVALYVVTVLGGMACALIVLLR